MSRSSADRQRAIDAILRPSSVVVLGASAKRPASGNEAIANLLAAGYPRDAIMLVHPTADIIDGLPVTRTIAQLDAVPDVALVSLPPHALLEALAALDSLGCAAAVVPSAGLTDEEQKSLEEFARTSAIAVHGNNCMGLLSVAEGIPLWFYDGILTDLPRGHISLVSQSGSATFLTRSIEGQGFARIVSTGNEVDLRSTDYLRWLAADDETSVVGLVLESLGDEEDFSDAVRVLRDAGKPLVVFKAGRTEAGQRATLAHTGAVTSSNDAYLAYFASLDVPVVEDYDQLAVALQLLAEGVRLAGARIAIITDSGGEAALAADIAADAGIPLAAFTPATIERLSELVPHTSIHNPLDAGASPLTSNDEYEEAYLVAARDAEVDAVMVIVEAHASMSEDEVRGAVDMFGGAVRRAKEAGKPVILASSSSIATHALYRELYGGVPLTRGILNSLVALVAASGNRTPLPVSPPRPSHLPSVQDAAVWRDRVQDQPAGILSHEITTSLLEAYGLELGAATMVESSDAAVEWAHGRYPVVAKVSSPDIAHRSDVGGVVANIPDADALRRALADIERSVRHAAPGAVIEGFEVQEHIGAAQEAMLGIASDPVIGPTVVAGSGGVLVELLADTVSTRCPVDGDHAARLLATTRISTLLSGYRSLQPVTPIEPFVEAMVNVSWLAADLRGVVEELDLNPLFIEHSTGRTLIVDALLTRTGAAALANPMPHRLLPTDADRTRA